jgi:hypothetical protein
MGYIDTFDIKYAWGRVRVRPTLPLCHWNADSEKK